MFVKISIIDESFDKKLSITKLLFKGNKVVFEYDQSLYGFTRLNAREICLWIELIEPSFEAVF